MGRRPAPLKLSPTRVGSELVVVPDAQDTPTHSAGVRALPEREVMLGLEPADIFAR